MAHKKAGGSTRLGRDSKPKYLGVKKYGGESVIPGNIIIRQRGSNFHPGTGVKCSKDFTIFALQTGTVQFKKKKVKCFTGKLRKRTFVSIVPK